MQEPLEGEEEEEQEPEEMKPLSLKVLSLIREQQQKHGLRHADYQRYRGYCSRRIRRIRKAVGLVQVSFRSCPCSRYCFCLRARKRSSTRRRSPRSS